MKDILSFGFSFLFALNLFSPVFAQSATTVTPTIPASSSTSTEQDKSAQDKKDHQDWVNNNRRYLKDLRREVQDIGKDAKEANVTKVNDLFTRYEACLTTQESKAGTQDFWNSTRDCDDISQDFNDELQDNLRPLRDCANSKRNIDDRRKEKKNVDRQIKDILRNDKDADVSALNEIIADMDDAFKTSDSLLSGPCSDDTRDELNDIQSDLNDFFQDFYSISNEVNQKANDEKQLDDGQKDFDKNIRRQCEKDIGKQMKDLEKDIEKAKKKGGVSADAQSQYDQVKKMFDDMCGKQLSAMDQALKNKDVETFNDARNEFWTLQQDFFNVLNESRNSVQQQEQAENVMKEIERRQKEMGQMRKEFDRAVKKSGGKEFPALKEILDKIDSTFEEAKKASKEDAQTWWQDYQQTLNDLQNEFWESFQGVQMVADSKRQIKDLKNEVKFREGDLKNWKRDPNVDASVVSMLEGILSQMKDVFAKLSDENAPSDPDSLRDLQDSFNDLRFQWDETTRDLFGKQQFTFMVEQVKREVEYAKSVLKDLLKNGEVTQEEYDVCKNFADEVLGKIDAGGFQSEDMFMDIEQKSREVCPAFDRIGNAPPPDQAYYQDYFHNNAGFEKDIGNAAADVMSRVSQDIVERVFQKMISDPSMIENLLKVAGDKYKDAAAGTLESVTSFYDDEATQRDLFAKKTEILELNQQLADLKKILQIAKNEVEELQKIQDEMAGYNFYGSAGDSIRDDVQDFIEQTKAQGLSKDEIRARVGELKLRKDEAIQQSKQAKLDAGIIPFRDADDHEWFTKFAIKMKQKGWVQGTGTSGGAEMNPSGITNVAEAIMMFARVEGIEDSAMPLSGVGKRLPDWAQAAAGTLDEAGVQLDDIFGGKNPGDGVSRGEVARLLVQVLGLPVVDASEANVFSDIKQANADEKAAIAAVFKAGIMTGQGGAGPKIFDVKGPLNRAALMKILDLASSLEESGQ